MNFINIKTNKSDIILKINDTDAGIVLVTCGLDVECLCNTVSVLMVLSREYPMFYL